MVLLALVDNFADEKATRNYFFLKTIVARHNLQIVGKKEAVKGYDHLRPEGTKHY